MFYLWNNPLLLWVMWTLVTGLVSQLTSDVIQRSDSQKTGAQTHWSLAVIFKPSVGEKASEY